LKWFELKVATRHLVASHGQTELTVGAVAVGVLLVVFLSSLINGLQVGLIDDVVGSIPHVTVEAETPSSVPMWKLKPGEVGVVTRLEKMSSRKRKIEQWRKVLASIKALPGVEAAAPSVEGSGIVGRGAKHQSAQIVGVIPEQYVKVLSLKNRVIEGDFLRLDQQDAAIGVKMAYDLGVGVGDRIKVASNTGVVQTFRVSCIFDLGIESANESRVYVGLQAAQAMLGLGRDITTVNVRAKRIFGADEVASAIRGFTNLTVTSWMESNKAFLDTLTAQNSSAIIIQGMTLLASAFGVASVMIVFVVQKKKDIGILKSMGATASQIQRIFILEGLGVGLCGAILGSGLGTGLCFLATHIVRPGEMFGGRPATIVPMQWDIVYVLAASAVAIVMGLISSLVPARRAANLNPVEAIRSV